MKNLYLKPVILTLLFIGLTSCNKDQSLSDTTAIQDNAETGALAQGVNNCSKPYYTISDYGDGAHVMENLIYVAKDYNSVNNLTSSTQYYDHYRSISDKNYQATQMFELHAHTYKDLGHDGYVDFATAEGIVSDELNLYIKSFRQELVSFIRSEQPTYEQFENFMMDKGASIDSESTLCNHDIYMSKLYHVTITGIAKYLYQADNGLAFTSKFTESRSCEGFWEKLVCGTGGGAVAWAVGAALGVFEWGKSIFTGTRDGEEVDLVQALYEVYKISSDMWTLGVSFYDWCCDTLFDDLQNCEEPTGCWKVDVGCNDHQINIVGPGLYTITAWEDNSNTDPENALTPEPRRNVSVPVPQNLSRIQGEVTCTDDNGNSQQGFDFFRQIGVNYQLPTPIWAWNQGPPATATTGQSFTFNIGNPPSTGDLYTMQVTASSGLTLNLITGGMYHCTPTASGSQSITVTFTHTCSGQQSEVQATVLVN